MAIDLRHYRILLSCPGDITDEKEVIEHEIAAFNRLYGIRNGISLDLMHWSTDVYPESGSAPQTAINKQIVHDCDAAIALFWTRFGSQTERYGSGTEEEIEELIQRGTQVFLYFSKKMIHPDAIDNEQYSKVKAFKERYSSRGIFFDYSTIEEFETLIRNHIALYFLQFINKAGGSQNKSILSVKSAKNGQLFDELITHQTRIRSGFQKVKEKINSLFPKIEKIHIEKPKQIPSDIPFGISNRELLKKLNRLLKNSQCA